MKITIKTDIKPNKVHLELIDMLLENAISIGQQVMCMGGYQIKLLEKQNNDGFDITFGIHGAIVGTGELLIENYVRAGWFEKRAAELLAA